MAKNMPKIVAKLRTSEKNCDCGIADLRLRSNISLKSCGIAIADSKKSAPVHLCKIADRPSLRTRNNFEEF
jgi:hypothetical protein